MATRSHILLPHRVHKFLVLLNCMYYIAPLQSHLYSCSIAQGRKQVCRCSKDIVCRPPPHGSSQEKPGSHRKLMHTVDADVAVYSHSCEQSFVPQPSDMCVESSLEASHHQPTEDTVGKVSRLLLLIFGIYYLPSFCRMGIFT